MGGSEQTQKTEIDPASAAEQEIMNMATDVLLPSYMEQSGYEMTPTTTTTYDNPELVESYKSQLADFDAQIAAAGDLPMQPGGQANAQKAALLRQKDNIQNKLNKELESARAEVSYDYELNEIGQRQQDMRMKSLDYQEEMTEAFMTSARKFMAGDFSITETQKQAIQESMANIREPVEAMLNEVNTEFENTGKSMTEALGGYMDEIRNTGLSTGAALNAIGERMADTKENVLAGIGEEESRLAQTGLNVKAALQGVQTEIDKTGASALESLEKSFEIHNTLARRGMEDFYKEQRRASANKAAALGRSSMDPQFQQEMQDNMMRKIETLTLQNAEREALMRSGLLESTGQRRESALMEGAGFEERLGMADIEAARRRTGAAESTGIRREGLGAEQAALAERQGRQMEGAAGQRIGIAERVGAGREQTAQQRAALAESTAQFGENMRWQQGMGIPAQQIGIGMNVAEYQNAVRQQGMANAAQGIGVVQQAGQPMFQERMAQPTTTTKQSGSVLGGILGGIGAVGSLAGAGAGAFEGVQQGNWFKQMARPKAGPGY